jgi:hypothetical protein
MNILSWAGYTFYGAGDSTERAASTASYGLLSTAPERQTGGIGALMKLFFELF